jgi:DNA-binding beta-propeller fold protein YncE
MKQKITIILSIVLLLALAIYMVSDLFLSSPSNVNPYDLKLDSLRIADTTKPVYKEVPGFSPGIIDIHCVAVDKQGNIYVGGTDTLRKFDMKGRLLSSIISKGYYCCLHIDQEGKIIAGVEDHVRVIDPQTRQTVDWKPLSDNSFITSIASSGDDIFVADYGQKLVFRCNQDGKVVKKIGQKDPNLGIPGIVLPSAYFDCATDKDGAIWVANTGRHLLEKYDAEGNRLESWGEPSMSVTGFCGCCNPSHFAILPDGNFVTAEKGIERVKLYSPKGEFIGLVAGTDSFDEGTIGLDLAIGINGEIIVLDPFRALIRVFSKEITASKP